MRVFLNETIGLETGPYYEKDDILLDTIRELQPGQKAIVICKKRKDCDVLVESFRRGRFRAHTVHSEYLCWQRNILADKFREGRLNVIIGTAVTLIDLNLGKVQMIVDYDGVPEKKKDRMQATKKRIIRFRLKQSGKFVSLMEV